MTKPEDDFGEAMRRALAAANEVEPADNGLERIRARASVRTPKSRLAAALAAVVPWPVYRVLQYRTLAGDLSREWATAARAWLGRAGRWIDGGWRRLADDWRADGARPLLDAGRTALTAGLTWLAALRRQRVFADVQRGLAAAGTWLAGTRQRASALRGRVSGSAVQPRHADTSPPPSRVGWFRPALAAAAVAFIATLAVTVGPVRQVFVQLGSSVISSDHNQSRSGGGTLNGNGTHLSPVPAASTTEEAPLKNPATLRPTPLSSKSSCSKNSKTSVSTTSATRANSCPTTAPPSPSTAPTQAVSPSTTPSATPTRSASTSPTASASATPATSPASTSPKAGTTPATESASPP